MQTGISLCTQADVEDIWSATGVAGRYDDDLSGGVIAAGEILVLNRFIMRASSYVSGRLKDRYKIVDFQGSNPPVDTPISVNWYASIIAAFYSAIRRGIACPQGLADLYKMTLDDLEKIHGGSLSLAEVNESFDTLPFVTNLHVDGNYRSAKLRKIQQISTTSEPTPNSGRKSYPERFPTGGYFID